MAGYPWSLAGSAVQGFGHKKKNTPCQDKTLCLQRNKVKVIALADGAGSAILSHLGAQSVIEAAAAYAADNFQSIMAMSDKGIVASFAEVIKNALLTKASQFECPEKALSSTLLLVAVRKDEFFSLHIGDGVIGVLDRKGLKVLSAPENGEYANMTWFTTTCDLESVIRVYRGDASCVSGFILMSDGVEPSLYNASECSLADAVMNLLYMNAKVNPKQMEVMLEESLTTVISSRTVDDCSIALMSRSRFKNFNEYQKYRRKVAKRSRVEGKDR